MRRMGEPAHRIDMLPPSGDVPAPVTLLDMSSCASGRYAKAARAISGCLTLVGSVLFALSTMPIAAEATTSAPMLASTRIGIDSTAGADAGRTEGYTDIAPAADSYDKLRAMQGEQPAALQALCVRIAVPYMEHIGADVFSADPEKLERLWAIRDRGIWFIEDVGGPKAEDLLERIGTGASPEVIRAAEIYRRGKVVSQKALDDLTLRADALAALARIKPARGREAIAKALSRGTLVVYDAFLPAERLPMPYVFFWGEPNDYRVYLRQRGLISTPELTARAREIAMAVGYAANGAWEYLRLASPEDARQTIRELLETRPSNDRDASVLPGSEEFWEAERSAGLTYERYHQFNMLREAVQDDLLSDDTLQSLASDKSDNDRTFWGAYGLARKGNERAKELLVRQSLERARQWKYLALAALTALGDGDAEDDLVATATEGTIVQRAYLAHAVTAVYDERLDEDTRDFFRDVIRALASDTAFVVVRYTLDRSFLLPADFAAELIVRHALHSRVLGPIVFSTPEDLAPLVGVGDGERLDVSKYYSDNFISPGELVYSRARWNLPAMRQLVFKEGAKKGEETPDYGAGMFESMFLLVTAKSSAWSLSDLSRLQDRAYALACLAYLGDAEAAEELCGMMDKGLDVPAEIAVQVRYPCMLPHLSRIVTRLAQEDPKSPVLLEAARSYMAAMRKHAAQTGVAVESTGTK